MEYKISLKQCKEFVAGDNTFLREILHPGKKDLKIGYSLAWFRVPPNKKTFRHSLAGSEIYYILSGKGRMNLNGKEFDVEANDTVYIPPGAIQYIENKSKTEEIMALCIVDPAWRKEDETVYG